MENRGNCRLCKNLIISQNITFTGGNLIINIPAGNYANCRKLCIILAQSIPNTATINALVFVTIGTGTQLYPLVKKNCKQVTACSLRTRTRYAVCVETTPTSGLFRMMGNICCAPNNDLTSINGTAPVVSEVQTGGVDNA